MDLQWIVLAVVLLCAIAFLIFLIKRNRKDKDEVVRFFNETDLEDEAEPRDKEEE